MLPIYFCSKKWRQHWQQFVRAWQWKSTVGHEISKWRIFFTIFSIFLGLLIPQSSVASLLQILDYVSRIFHGFSDDVSRVLTDFHGFLLIFYRFWIMSRGFIWDFQMMSHQFWRIFTDFHSISHRFLRIWHDFQLISHGFLQISTDFQ